MGNRIASEFAEAVHQGDVSLYGALEYHLTCNHYPPIPRSIIPVAIQAIDLYNAGEYDAELTLPPGIQWRGKDTCPLNAAIEGWHLEAFLGDNE